MRQSLTFKHEKRAKKHTSTWELASKGPQLSNKAKRSPKISKQKNKEKKKNIKQTAEPTMRERL